MQLKLALIGCVVVGCALAGRSFAWASGRRRRLLEELLAALRMLKIQIVSLIEPLESALRRSDLKLFNQVADRLLLSSRALEAWQSVLSKECRRGGNADCLQKRELDALTNLFERLGESGRATQEEALRACIAAVEAACEEARIHSERTDKLYTSMGLMLGLAVAVLLI